MIFTCLSSSLFQDYVYTRDRLRHHVCVIKWLLWQQKEEMSPTITAVTSVLERIQFLRHENNSRFFKGWRSDCFYQVAKSNQLVQKRKRLSLSLLASFSFLHTNASWIKCNTSETDRVIRLWFQRQQVHRSLQIICQLISQDLELEALTTCVRQWDLKCQRYFPKQIRV